MSEQTWKQLALFPNPYAHKYKSGGKWANECKCGEHMFHSNHQDYIRETDDDD